MAAMYAVYHGPKGLQEIAERTALLTQTLAETLEELGFANENKFYFDTLKIKGDKEAIRPLAENAQGEGLYGLV